MGKGSRKRESSWELSFPKPGESLQANVMLFASSSAQSTAFAVTGFSPPDGGPHPGVHTVLMRALAVCEWVDQLISALDFAVVQLDLWELPG